jgi:hypothetical protein
MTLIVILVAVGLLAGAGYWWWSRRSLARQGPPLTARAARAAEQFASVEIRRRSGACSAARALEGQRFLANQAPALPLAGCTKTRCDCTFAKRSDRRTDERRWGHEALTAMMFLKAERRKRGGRRDAD